MCMITGLDAPTAGSDGQADRDLAAPLAEVVAVMGLLFVLPVVVVLPSS